MKNFKI